MTKIVGHRGAKALELENTIKGFKLAKQLGVDGIELDVLNTKDGKIVVCHDNDLERLSGQKVLISELTFAELAEIHLSNDETIPLLYDVLAVIKSIPVILDIKTDHCLENMFEVVSSYPDIDFTIVTDRKKIIKICKQIRPDIPVFIERKYPPLGVMNSVKKHGADGLNLHYFWLNPLTYKAAMKKGIKIQVWTVNNILVGYLIKKLYPGVWICTNHPDKFLEALSDNKLKV